ncbi:MAG: hypothetical protein WDO74_21185 [Pseudomonadota bacterium]
MRNSALSLSASSLLLGLAAVSCAKQSDQPPAGYAPPQTLPAGPTVTQAPGYGDGTTSAPTPVLAASPTAPAAAGVPGAALSTPNPLALPCTVDANCLTHRCNVAARKCAWPCQTDNDCMPGNACIAPTCLPKLQ